MGDVDTLVQKVSTDPGFVKELSNAPEATLKKNNLSVSDDLLNTIKEMDESGLRELAKNYSSDKAAC